MKLSTFKILSRPNTKYTWVPKDKKIRKIIIEVIIILVRVIIGQDIVVRRGKYGVDANV